MKTERGRALNEQQSRKKAAPDDLSKALLSRPHDHESSEENRSTLSIKKKVWVFLVGIIATIFAVILVAELYELQVVSHDKYALLASQMHWRRIRDVPIRGDILDVNGNVLASTTYEYTIGVTPKDVRSIKGTVTPEEISAKMAEYLHLDPASVLKSLQNIDATYIQLAKKINRADMELLKSFLSENNIGGVKIDPVPKRYYVYSDLAAQVVGYADQSNTTLIGQYGIEAYYNSILSGTEGYTYVEVDNYSGALPYSPPTTIEKTDGYNVVLNIDLNIQKIAEKACEEAYYAYSPKEGVSAIVMDPYTGAVLAMVSTPDFDLNAPRACPPMMNSFLWESLSEADRMDYLMSSVWRNRAISDTYEPGSTFKVLTTAIALEEGLTYEDELFSDAPIEVSEMHTISCWREHDGGNHGIETLKQAFERSCNPIFVQLAQRIGIKKYYQYVRNFGFYEKTGVDLPAEEKGIFHLNPNIVDLSTLSFGESSTVTPLQLANVYCALVNGGTLMKPQLAKYLTDSYGNIIKEFKPQPMKTIFSELTADRVKAMMKTVVTEGTGTAGYVEGYRVAGKTSTSTIDVGDDKGMHVLSFGCYAPYDNPEIVVLVVINKPEDKELGSSAATKVAARIVADTLDYMDVKRILTSDDYKKMTTKYKFPEVVGMTIKEARRTLYKEGFTVLIGEDNMTDDQTVTFTFPASPSILYRNGTIVLYSTEQETTVQRQVMVPDFTGKNINECLRLAADSGVNVTIRGNSEGVVISQNPEYGYAVPGNGDESEPPVSPDQELADSSSAIDPDDVDVADGGTTDGDEQGNQANVPQRITVPAGTIIELIME